MESVIKKLPIAAFVLGEQAASDVALYRKASFVVLTRVGGKNIAYNTLTKELAELSEHEAELLRSEDVPADKVSEPLIRAYFLVPKHCDERKICDDLAGFVRAARKRGVYRSFTVFTTTECNARCFYCYENGCKQSAMSAQTAKNTAEFIINNSHGNSVDITWYGGEPLMNTEAMDIISGELLARGVEFSSRLATNASLITDELVMRAVNVWHVTKAQVTLDGTPPVYERIKAYTDKKYTFESVLCNIEKLLDADIKVNIRLNVDVHNIDDMSALCDLLAERFSGRRGLNVYSELLFECEGAKRPMAQCDRLELAKRMIELEDKLSSSGVLKPRRLKYAVETAFCKADALDAMVIGVDGRLLKCDFYTDSHTVGDVCGGVDAVKESAELTHFTKRVDCGGCSVYPICLRSQGCPTGGCDAARRYLAEERLVRSVKYAYLRSKNDL